MIRLKEQLIKSVYTSTKDVKETNEQYQQHIKTLERVNTLEKKEEKYVLYIYLGNGKS